MNPLELYLLRLIATEILGRDRPRDNGPASPPPR
jgi:hypothetical protein